MCCHLQQQHRQWQLCVRSIWDLSGHMWLPEADAQRLMHGGQQHSTGLWRLISDQNLRQPGLHNLCLECESPNSSEPCNLGDVIMLPDDARFKLFLCQPKLPILCLECESEEVLNHETLVTWSCCLNKSALDSLCGLHCLLSARTPADEQPCCTTNGHGTSCKLACASSLVPSMHKSHNAPDRYQYDLCIWANVFSPAAIYQPAVIYWMTLNKAVVQGAENAGSTMQVSDWSKCSASCMSGDVVPSMTRDVTCVRYTPGSSPTVVWLWTG